MTLTVEEPRAGFARRAEALHAQGDSEGALRLLTAGVRRFPGDVTALLVMAGVCRETGREPEARDWLRAARRLDPGCPAARAADAGEATAAIAEPPPAPEVAPASAFTPRTPVPPVPAEPVSDASDAVDVSDVSDVMARLQPEARIVPRTPATPVPSPFNFPDVGEEDEEEEFEIGENSAPHIATVTLAEIYLQQGLKEQATQIYRQLLERQPDDESVRERLQDILRELEEP
ncbi:MAG TPA: tetratricopeptide repeat protein [Fibrobacteria bacterium]|nr:tetratricopeptide repeat protein [Fibrobacteria bacterium]